MVVTDKVAFGDDVAEERRHAQVADGIDIELNGKLILRLVTLEDGLGRAAPVHDHDVDDQTGMLDDRSEMLFGGVAIGLPGLRHDVADVDAKSLSRAQCFAQLPDDEVGKDRGIERARTDEDEIRALQRFERLVHRHRVGWIERELNDPGVTLLC